MPRPTTAQVFYGSLTVVLATLVMLVATDARSGAAVVALAAVALALGLAVAAALTVPAVRGGRAAQAPSPSDSPTPAAAPASAPTSAPTPAPAPAEASVPRPRVGGADAGPLVGEPSLRR